MERFSIIIPTMWKSDLIYPMIQAYNDCPLVSEVIIISNASLPKNFMHKALQNITKVKVCFPDSNLFVNASWNFGAKLAKDTIVLANDDIVIENVYALLFEVFMKSKYDLIGATVNNMANFTGIISWNKEKGFPRKSFGCFMVCRKYTEIPEAMKILCGDNWLFDHSDSVGIIGAGYIQTPISVTIKSDPTFSKIGLADKEVYRKLVK